MIIEAVLYFYSESLTDGLFKRSTSLFRGFQNVNRIHVISL